MKITQYAVLTVCSCLLAAGLFYLSGLFGETLVYQDFFLISMLFFLLLASVIFFASKYLTTRGKQGSFISMVIFNVLMKLILSFGLVYWYVQTNGPQTKWFVIPFLINYLIFTIMETYALTKIAEN